MKLKEFSDKNELYDEMYNYTTFLDCREMDLLLKIPPKSRLVLTNKALMCYGKDNIATLYRPEEYAIVQLMIDTHSIFTPTPTPDGVA